ncbi:MAG: tRNA pseudouridine(38-40) synthase TruA [Acidaminococcaceae bacterium]|nr:tRNA pseudouridine(38-40) synthase TruA [Acidaminococcaceae bacterium]
MRTLKLTVCYDGSNYFGFQRQTKELTIQEVLEEKLARVCGEPVQIVGSGRTDARVHARGQVVSFATRGTIPLANMSRAMNSILPDDIRILQAEEAPDGFNARKDACWKEYEYRIRFTPQPDPFTRNYVWQLREEPDLEKMQEAAQLLLGTHDFSGFQSAGSSPVSPVKTIYVSRWQKEADDTLIYRIAGDGFVYHMVRNLVWSMVQIGLGKKTPQAMQQELQMQRGEFENSPAPPQGLYLARVEYEPFLS